LKYTINYAQTKLRKGGADVPINAVITGNPYVTQLDNIVKDQAMVKAFVDPFPPVMENMADKAGLEARMATIKDMLAGLIGLTGFKDETPAVSNGPTVKSRFEQYTKPGTGGTFTSLEKLMREALLIDTSYPGGAALGKVTGGDFPAYQVSGVTPDPNIYGNPVPNNDADAVKNIAGRTRTLYSNVYLALTGWQSEVKSLLESVEQSLASSSALYANIKTAIKREGVVVPPGGAIAGVYAAVDGTKGVWKAPANVPLNTVIEPLVNIDNNMQDDLNVDANGGKSINAIRSFFGKGTLVWGARTLAGNDNEWRYVPVRRLFITVEESARKATESFVFEPNDANTWVKVRALLENYLTVLWRQGALAGAKPEHAFFVKCGLGQTMTAQDILEGRLIVEIGMAAVRPAEFIILRFMHKLQQA
jgi:hypothetical protein